MTTTNTTTAPEVGSDPWFADLLRRFHLQKGLLQVAANGALSPPACDDITNAGVDEIARINEAVIPVPAPSITAIRVKARLLVDDLDPEEKWSGDAEGAYHLKDETETTPRLAASIWADLERLAADAAARQSGAPCTPEIASAALEAVDSLRHLEGICSVFHSLVEAGDLEQDALCWMAARLSDIKEDIRRHVEAVHDLTRNEESKATQARVEAMIGELEGRAA